ncbi:hypothetical protein UlMin_006145 [Ulmus minor]
MDKMNKSKASKKVQEDNVLEQEKPKSKTKSSNEVDDIFAGKKRKKIESEKSGRPSENGVGKPMKIRKKKRDISSDDDGFGEPSSRPKKKTGDGFVIYTEEELGLNKADAGGTPLCPFDCSCCF